jgi:hypothetical protein
MNWIKRFLIHREDDPAKILCLRNEPWLFGAFFYFYDLERFSNGEITEAECRHLWDYGWEDFRKTYPNSLITKEVFPFQFPLDYYLQVDP